jgi:hypothetical protein
MGLHNVASQSYAALAQHSSKHRRYYSKANTSTTHWRAQGPGTQRHQPPNRIPNSTTFFSTLNIALALLTSIHARIAARDATVNLFHAAVYNMVDGYRSRDDLVGTRCITKAITNTARHEACTVTANRTHPGTAETFTVPAVMTCHQTGVPLAEGRERKL